MCCVLKFDWCVFNRNLIVETISFRKQYACVLKFVLHVNVYKITKMIDIALAKVISYFKSRSWKVHGVINLKLLECVVCESGDDPGVLSIEHLSRDM